MRIKRAGSVAIEFDGVYDYSEVWINGQLVGGRPYGFSSFQCDLTPFVKFGSDDNVIAVRVDHSRFADSRFYTGSGIYRNVRLVFTDKLRIAHWGVSVTTPKIKSDSAIVRVETTVENGSAGKGKFSLESEIVAPGGEIVASLTTAKSAAGNSTQTLAQEIKILKPELWSAIRNWRQAPAVTLCIATLNGQSAKSVKRGLQGLGLLGASFLCRRAANLAVPAALNSWDRI